MRARNQNPEWVIGLRSSLRLTCGPSWRVVEHRGKCKLDIRLANGKRKYKTLGISWDFAHARRIQESVEQIYSNVQKGLTIDEAVEAAGITNNPKVLDEVDPQILLNAFAKYETHYVKTLGYTQSNWNKEWGGLPHDKDSEITPKRVKAGGKTYKALVKVADAQSVDKLFEKLSSMYEPGSRARQMMVQNVANFLRWATSSKSNYLLDEKWQPFAKGNSGIWVGTKSGEDVQAKKQTVAIELDDAKELINSLDIDDKRNGNIAKRWKFLLEILTCYGLRPEEIRHLKLIDGKLWSTWVKRTAKGSTKKRLLQSFPPELADEWKIVERFKKNEPLPDISGGVGDAMSTYLNRNDVWKRLRKDFGVVSKSFRHGYSKRLHQVYGLTSYEAAGFLGHSVEVHESTYSDYWKAKEQESVVERAKRFASMNNPKKSDIKN